MSIFTTSRAWRALCVLALAGCQNATIGDVPGTADSGSASDAATVPDVYVPPIPDAAPPDAAIPDAPVADAPPPDAPPPPPCVEGNDQILDPTTGHCYMVFIEVNTWNGARTTCASLGAHLVVVNSQEEQDLIVPLAAAVDNWMGGNDIATEGAWGWLNGEPLSYTNWRAGEPNNNDPNDPAGEDCMIIEGARGGTWDDRSCVRSYGLICERE